VPGDIAELGPTPVESVRKAVSLLSDKSTDNDLAQLKDIARQAILQVQIPHIPPMKSAMEQICEVSRLLVNGATSSLVVRQGSAWEVGAASGEGAEKICGMRVDPDRKSVAGYVINTHKPYFFSSIGNIPDLAVNENRSRRFGDSFCAIPIMDQSGALLGVLNIAGMIQDGAAQRTRQESIKGILDAIAIKLTKIREKESLFLVGDDIESLKQVAMDKEKMLMMSVHDIKNTLSLITANLYYLQQMNLGEEAEEIIGLVKFGSDRSLDLVLSILDSGMMRDQKLRPNFSTVDLNELFECLANEFSVYATRMEVQIILDLPERTYIRADRGLLRRLLANLMDNAMKYSPKGSGVIISAVPMGESVDLSVEDQGMGVSKQQQESIFNFLQGNGQKGRDGAQNYGIGLAFCKMVAWVHGGSIWVEQGPRGGAQFVVRLPRD